MGVGHRMLVLQFFYVNCSINRDALTGFLMLSKLESYSVFVTQNTFTSVFGTQGFFLIQRAKLVIYLGIV